MGFIEDSWNMSKLNTNLVSICTPNHKISQICTSYSEAKQECHHRRRLKKKKKSDLCGFDQLKQ